MVILGSRPQSWLLWSRELNLYESCGSEKISANSMQTFFDNSIVKRFMPKMRLHLTDAQCARCTTWFITSVFTTDPLTSQLSLTNCLPYSVHLLKTKLERKRRIVHAFSLNSFPTCNHVQRYTNPDKNTHRYSCINIEKVLSLTTLHLTTLLL